MTMKASEFREKEEKGVESAWAHAHQHTHTLLIPITSVSLTNVPLLSFRFVRPHPPFT